MQHRPVPLENIYTAAQAQVAYLVSAVPYGARVFVISGNSHGPLEDSFWMQLLRQKDGPRVSSWDVRTYLSESEAKEWAAAAAAPNAAAAPAAAYTAAAAAATATTAATCSRGDGHSEHDAVRVQRRVHELPQAVRRSGGLAARRYGRRQQHDQVGEVQRRGLRVQRCAARLCGGRPWGVQHFELRQARRARPRAPRAGNRGGVGGVCGGFGGGGGGGGGGVGGGGAGAERDEL